VKLIIRLYVKETRRPLKAFISASAIGYYGAISTEQVFTELEPAAHDFLGKTCKLWEDSVDQFSELKIRTVKIRTGVVLASKGGALAKIIQPVKMGIGSALGNGNQYIPWIHIQDLCNIYLKAIEDNTISGAYNAVAPDNKTNKEFISILARELKKPLLFPNIPAFALQLIFGQRSEMLLKGSRISSLKIIETGFRFNFPSLENAIKDLIRKKK